MEGNARNLYHFVYVDLGWTRSVSQLIVIHLLKTKTLDLPEVLKLNNCDLKGVDKAKSLGVIIDEKLIGRSSLGTPKAK